jgi:hypothetical protein
VEEEVGADGADGRGMRKRMVVQAFIFDSSKFSYEDAVNFLQERECRADDVLTGVDTLRFRQRSPSDSDMSTFRTVDHDGSTGGLGAFRLVWKVNGKTLGLVDGVRVVVGALK